MKRGERAFPLELLLTDEIHWSAEQGEVAREGESKLAVYLCRRSLQSASSPRSRFPPASPVKRMRFLKVAGKSSFSTNNSCPSSTCNSPRVVDCQVSDRCSRAGETNA